MQKTCTPRKFNMEPKNASLEKEKHLKTTIFLGSMLNFRGVHACNIRFLREIPQFFEGSKESEADIRSQLGLEKLHHPPTMGPLTVVSKA